MNATYTKLKDGSWGVRVVGATPTAGSSIAVQTKAGSQKTEIVARVLWTGADKRTGETIHLCSVAPKSKGRTGRRCRTGGNCSSFGSGKSCGASDCDGY